MNNPFLNNFCFDFSNITLLILENIEFSILNQYDEISLEDDWESTLILKEYNWDPNAYWIFSILKDLKMFYSLKEIQIGYSKLIVWEDLYNNY